MLAITSRPLTNLQKPADIVRGSSARLPWAWDGLCFAVPFNDATRDAARDVVWGAAPSAVASLTWAKDDRGNVAPNLAATSYINYPDNPAHNKPSTEITVYVRLRRAGSGDSFGGVLTKRYAATDPWLSWGIVQDDTTNALAGHLTIGGTPWRYWTTTYALPTNMWVSAFLRWRTGTAATLHVLGERGNTLDFATDAESPTGSISYTTTEPLNFNATENNGVNFNADYSQGLVWSRRLGDQELQALVADPFGWYAPRRETVVLSGTYLLAPQHVVNGTATAVPAQGGD